MCIRDSITDHLPLVACFRNDLQQQGNARIAGIREKLQGFTFQVEFLAGKLNVLADCLSRMPSMKKFDKEELDELREMEELVSRSTSIYWEKNTYPR